MAQPFLTGILTTQSGSSLRNLSRVQGFSLTFHLLALLLLAHFSVKQMRENNMIGDQIVGKFLFPGYAPKPKPIKKVRPGGGGSGGDENPIIWTRGQAPPFGPDQIVPPAPQRNPDAMLIVPPTLEGPPELRITNINAENYGDPLQKLLTGSQGPGERDGYGDKCCGGIGPRGNGRGYGPGEASGMGGDRPRGGTRGTSLPVCEYCPNPSYTEEARKVKFHGTVLLRAVITADGRATNIRVVKGVGLGLDERAIESVSRWKFRPSRGPDGRPVETWTEIEINFRIY